MMRKKHVALHILSHHCVFMSARMMGPETVLRSIMPIVIDRDTRQPPLSSCPCFGVSTEKRGQREADRLFIVAERVLAFPRTQGTDGYFTLFRPHGSIVVVAESHPCSGAEGPL